MDATVDPEEQQTPRTHGSEQRPPRDLLRGLRAIDLAEVGASLGGEPAFSSDGRNSRTIHDDGTVRVGVTTVASGAEVGADRSDRYVALSIVEGSGQLSRGSDERSSLASGQVAIVAPGSGWTFQATEPVVFVAFYWAA